MKTSFRVGIGCLLLGGAFSGSSSAHAQTAPVRVACIGDSITAGVGTQHPDIEAFPAVLGRELGEGYEVKNFGVSARTMLKKGDIPYWREAAFQAAQDFKPDIVVIMLGTNDSKHPTPQAPDAPDNWRFKNDYVRDYEEMVADFQHANPKADIFVAQPVPAFPGRWGINNETIHNEIGPMVAQVAKDTGAHVIDLYTPLHAQKALFPDTVHPNATGAKVIADVVFLALLSSQKGWEIRPPMPALP